MSSNSIHTYCKGIARKFEHTKILDFDSKETVLWRLEKHLCVATMISFMALISTVLMECGYPTFGTVYNAAVGDEFEMGL